MLKISVCSLLLVAVVFDVVPHRTSSTPLNRVQRSPDTTPESHISNFLHQHRADSRAEKPNDHPGPNNASDPIHTTHRPHSTTTEPPIMQTELLVNLIHNTIQTVRDQLPALIGAISSPRDPPSTTVHPKKERHAGHATHAHSMHERSTNETSGEDAAGSGERNEENEEEAEEDREGDEFDGDFPNENNNAGILPPALIRTILEASAGSSARGSAGASAGLVASTFAGSSTGSSSGTGRTTRQAAEDEPGSGSGEFLVGILRTKARALTTLIFAPFLSASSFFQRSIGYASSTSSGVSTAEDRPIHDIRHSGDSHSHHHADNHHHSDGHNRDTHEHGQHTESHGHGHPASDHGHHSNNHGHNSNDHGHNSTDHGHSSERPDPAKNHNTTTNEIESANLIFNGYEQDKPSNHRLVFRAASNDAKDIVTDDLLKQEASNVDEAPFRIVLANANLYDADTVQTIVRKTREARTIFSEGFGIYILEIFGSIAGLTWGAIHQVTHLFEGRDDETEAYI